MYRVGTHYYQRIHRSNKVSYFHISLTHALTYTVEQFNYVWMLLQFY